MRIHKISRHRLLIRNINRKIDLLRRSIKQHERRDKLNQRPRSVREARWYWLRNCSDIKFVCIAAIERLQINMPGKSISFTDMVFALCDESFCCGNEKYFFNKFGGWGGLPSTNRRLLILRIDAFIYSCYMLMASSSSLWYWTDAMCCTTANQVKFKRLQTGRLQR